MSAALPAGGADILSRFRPTLDQESLYAGFVRAPAASAYVESMAVSLRGALDIPCLEQALALVIDRHPPLCSTFAVRDGRLEQRVHAARPVALRRGAGDGGLQRWLTAIAQDPVDLEAGPLYRAGIYDLDDGRRVLALAAHHIVCDGWSRRAFLLQLSEAYNALRKGRRPVTPPLKNGFEAYARDTRTEEARARQAASVAFWRRTLDGAPATIRAPLGGSSDDPVGRGEMILVDWSDLTATIRAAAVRRESSAFPLLLFALKTALTGQTGASDVVLGFDFAARPPGTEDLIGFFARQLPLRLTAAHDTPRAVQATILDALAHADASLVDILAATGREELFAIKLSLEQGLEASVRFENLEAEPLAIPIGGAKFPLLLNMALDGDRLTCRAEFEPARVSRDRVETLLGMFRGRCESMGGTEQRFERRRVGRLRPDPGLEPVLEPVAAMFDADGAGGLGTHDQILRQALADKGAVLLRRVRVGGPQDLADQLGPVIGPLMDYTERSSPRTLLGRSVYSSTDYPAAHAIAPHHENAYASCWPRWIAFYCAQPAQTGGRTPIVAARTVWASLPNPLRTTFGARGLRYIRRFGGPLGPSAGAAFGETDPGALKRDLEAAGYVVDRDAEGRITTTRLAPAIRPHPDSGEPVWFNHAHFFHPSRWSAGRPEAETDWLPYDVRFGDGGRISPDDIATIERAYADAQVGFDWCEGDLLILDNMRFAHGREAFGGFRRIWALMGWEMRDA